MADPDVIKQFNLNDRLGKYGVSKFSKEINHFSQKGCFKLIKTITF